MKIGGYFLLFLTIALVFDVVTGFVSVTAPGVSCSPSNSSVSCNDQIGFDTSVFGNSTTVTEINSETSRSWSATNNEAMVLVAASNIQGIVTSITDSASDTFTQQLMLSLNQQHFEIWTSFFKGMTGSLNTVTVNWNATSNNVFVLSAYRNVQSFGNVTGIQGTSTTGSFSIETTFSSSWIAGGIGIEPNSPNQQSIVPNSGLIRRVDSCTITGGGGNCDVEAAILDNSTGLPANFFSSFGGSWSGTCSLGCQFQMGAIEMKGFDLLAPQPNPSNVCTSSNGLCITSQYFINYVGTNTRPNALNQALALNTAYCTGVTSKALTTIRSDEIFGWANWGGISLNTTNLKMLIQYYISTNVPSTTFGAGLCATGGVLSGTFTDFFSRSGTSLNMTNAFPISMSACYSVCVTNATSSTTYYAWIEVTPLNFSLGHANFDQICNQVYSECWISLQEER